MRTLIDQVRTLVATRGGSKDDAKQRLRVVLIHDQIALTPGQMDQMRDEILAVVRRYVDVDEGGVDFKLERGERDIALVSNMPVRRAARG